MLLSAIVVGMMLAMPVSAGSRTVTFYDKQGDLGKPWYSGGNGNHVFGDPYSWYSGNCPIGNAGYLDMRSGWVTVKNDQITMGLVVDSPVPTDGKLPASVTEVRWAWFFYQSIDVTTGGSYSPFTVFIVWDGTDFSAVLVDRTSGSPPFALTHLDNFIVEGNVLTVTMSLANIPGTVAWFCETMVFHDHPWSLDQWPSMAGWQVPDLTDYQGPLAIYWPWQAMP